MKNREMAHRIGPYRITGKLGEGGMGVVYRAEDSRLGREVAIKVLPDEVIRDAERVQRFEREARAVAALNHPNILTIHDIGNEHGVPFMVTELLEGETLRQRLLRGPIRAAKAATQAAEIAAGLARAHSKGIVHRDLKPDNLFLTNDGSLKILDFGLAKLAASKKSANDVTDTDTAPMDTKAGTVLGTMGYMAPEQLKGVSVDARADIFALGCVLYEMLTGRRPFAGGSTAENISAVLRDAPPPMAPLVPAALQSFVLRCLEKKPRHRYQTAGEALAALESLTISDSGVETPTPDSKRINTVTMRTPGHSMPTVAVMPYANLCNDAEQEYFCDGMAEETLNAISKIRGLKVLARSSSFSYKGKQADVREIGRSLGADHMLEGSVRREGERIRITVQLVQTSDGSQLWSDRFDRTLDDVFAVQDEISIEVAEQLRTALLKQEKDELQRAHVPKREAYDLYIRGRFLWNRRERGDLLKAIELYEQSAETDPLFAQPRAGLAEVFNVLGIWCMLPPKVAYERSRVEINAALELDSDLAEAHAALAFLCTYHDFDWRRAEPAFRRAITLDPQNGNYLVWYAAFLNGQRRFDEAAEHCRHAYNLEPLSPSTQATSGCNLIVAGQTEEGLERMKNAIELNPDLSIGNYLLGWVLSVYLMRCEEAIPYLERALEAGLISAAGPLGYCAAVLQDEHRMQTVRSALTGVPAGRHVPRHADALIALGHGDLDGCLDGLEASADEGEFECLTAVWPGFSQLYTHPRFKAYQRRLGLPVPVL